MKNKLWIMGIILLGVVIIISILYAIDLHKMKLNEPVIFSTWGLKYSPAVDKPQSSLNHYDIKLEELPENYTLKQAVSDGCLVITYQTIYNKDKIETFVQNIKLNQADTMRVVSFTKEGDLIIDDLCFQTNQIFEIIHDSTRDEYSAIEDRKITKTTYSQAEFLQEEKEDYVEVYLKTKDEKVYLFSYLKTLMQVNSVSFIGTVLEASLDYLLVEPEEGSNERKSSDRFYISLGANNDILYSIGQKIVVTHTGFIKETDPAQLDVLKVELYYFTDFKLQFEPSGTSKKNIVLAKEENERGYFIYEYGGNIDITIKGEQMPLREALLSKKVTVEDLLIKANQEVKDGKISNNQYDDRRINTI